MNPKKRSLDAFEMLLGSYALLTFIYVLPIDNLFMIRRTTSVFYFFPAVYVALYFASRIIDRRVRKYLVTVGILIVFWSILRAGKYIAFEENESIARFIWYLYYVSLLMIPQFSFQAALAVGRPEDQKIPKIHIFTGVITVLCIMTVLTNDLHQLVFRFRPGFENWDADYTHEPLFWIIVVWDGLFFLGYTLVLLHKCRLSASRKLAWIPISYLAFCVFGMYLLDAGLLPRVWGKTIGEFPEIACYMLGGFWILCITIGLIPSNKGYGKLLRETSLATRITNYDLEVTHQSRSAIPLTKEQLASEETIVIEDNILVHRSPVSGGFAYWQVDVTELNRINRELEDNKERIAEEAALIRQANELKERRAQIDAKSKVYDEIALRVLPQSQMIAKLSKEAQEDDSKFEKNMRLVSIYAAYIKRVSNMMLLASEGAVKKGELKLALLESARYLNKAGILVEVDGQMDEGFISADALIKVYEHFEVLLEQALPTLGALHVTLSGNALKLNFEGVILTLPDEWEGSAETDEDITFVRLFIRKGGDTV